MAMRAKTSFVGLRRRVVHAGDLVDDKDPVIKGRESLFEPVETYLERHGVEATTAAPGERRTVTPPQKRAAKKQAKPVRKTETKEDGQ